MVEEPLGTKWGYRNYIMHCRLDIETCLTSVFVTTCVYLQHWYFLNLTCRTGGSGFTRQWNITGKFTLGHNNDVEVCSVVLPTLRTRLAFVRCVVGDLWHHRAGDAVVPNTHCQVPTAQVPTLQCHDVQVGASV